MATYTSFPLIFVAACLVVAGLALLAVVAYLARLVGRHRRSLGALLKLAKTGLDPLQIPAAAWPALADGGIKRLDYSGDWFGQPVQNSFGATHDNCSARPFFFKISTDVDVRLDFHLYARTDRGETRLFAENLAGVFRLLLETAVHSKLEALSAALAEQARLTLYLQHDLRNLAQWVEWLAADFATAQDDDALLTITRRLSIGAPLAAARARRILDATCKTRITNPPAPQSIALAGIIRQAAEHAGLPVTIDQDTHKQETCVFLRRDLLDRTLDNLFANVAPLLRSHPEMIIAVTITQDADKVSARIKIPRLAEMTQLSPDKLFEPFASGRPGGLGLGLYQAHKSLIEAGGDLAAEMREQDIYFSLSLPGAATDATPV